MSFNTTAGSIKRKADLFELPTYAKKVTKIHKSKQKGFSKEF